MLKINAWGGEINMIGKKIVTISIVSIMILQVSLSGCGDIDPVLDALNNAISSLELQSTQWQQILTTLIKDLEDAGQSLIKNEVNQVLQNAIAASGVTIICVINSIGTRVLDALKRIRADFLNQPYPPVEPIICDTVPPDIDMEAVPDSLNSISLYGYNIVKSNIKLILREKDGTEWDVSQHMANPTHFLITVNLAYNGVPLDEKSDKLIVYMKSSNKELHDINILQETPPTTSYHLWRITGAVHVTDDDFWGDSKKTFPMDNSWAFIDNTNKGTYNPGQMCVDEVRGELDITIELIPSTGQIKGNGIIKYYEDTSGTCGGNELRESDSFSFLVNSDSIEKHHATLMNDDGSVEYDLIFHNEVVYP
jgi:hypothetical protein